MKAAEALKRQREQLARMQEQCRQAAEGHEAVRLARQRRNAERNCAKLAVQVWSEALGAAAPTGRHTL